MTHEELKAYGRRSKLRHLKRNDGEESWGNENKNPQSVVSSQNGFNGEAD